MMVGDLTYDAHLLELGHVPGVGSERGLREATAMINTMRERIPDLVILPAHDPGAAFQATGAPNIIAYSAQVDPAAVNPQAADDGPHIFRSYGWARATGRDGATAQAWLEIGESYGFTAAASIRAVEETLTGSVRGTFSPATAFGADFPLTVPNTSRIDTILAETAA